MAGHQGTLGQWSEGKHFKKMMKKACENIDEYAEALSDPKEREDYLALIAGVRAELRLMDYQRSRKVHVLEDAALTRSPSRTRT